jgi:hypothetical protein
MIIVVVCEDTNNGTENIAKTKYLIIFANRAMVTKNLIASIEVVAISIMRRIVGCRTGTTITQRIAIITLVFV